MVDSMKRVRSRRVSKRTEETAEVSINSDEPKSSAHFKYPRALSNINEMDEELFDGLSPDHSESALVDSSQYL